MILVTRLGDREFEVVEATVLTVVSKSFAKARLSTHLRRVICRHGSWSSPRGPHWYLLTFGQSWR